MSKFVLPAGLIMAWTGSLFAVPPGWRILSDADSKSMLCETLASLLSSNYAIDNKIVAFIMKT